MSDAEILIRNLLHKIAPEHDFGNYDLHIKAINSEGANYTSDLFLVTVKCPHKKDVELFAKVACISEKLRDVMYAERLYYLEAFFYKKLIKVYKTLEMKHNLADEDRYLTPKFYGCNTTMHKETVVLQNLVDLGYGTYSRFISVDWEHAASSIETLAKLHALSFAYQKENPEEFDEVCKDLVFIEKNRDDSVTTLWDKIISQGLDVVKEEYRPKMLKFLEDAGEEGKFKFRRPLGTNVIVHGDFRPSNLLYKRRQDNKIQTIAVDYQTIHVGSPAIDLIYFELCGTDSKFRAEHHDRLVDHYYEELCAAMQRLGVDATEVYSREVFNKELMELLPQQVMLGLFVLPIVLVEADKAPRVDGEGGIETFAFPTNDLFAERFSGIVEDCVKWGVL